MAGVERAHGRHQRHAVSARPPAADNGPQFNQCWSRLHGNQAFVRRTHRAFVNVVAEALNQGGLMNMAANGAHVIVFGNEKGGTGKSTTAMHVAIALAAGGRTVPTIDLDARQDTTARYLANSLNSTATPGLQHPQP